MNVHIDGLYMNNLLMKYYMKVCIYVDDYYMNNLVDELLHEGMYIC